MWKKESKIKSIEYFKKVNRNIKNTMWKKESKIETIYDGFSFSPLLEINNKF